MTLDITVAPPDTGPSGTRRQVAQVVGGVYVTGGETLTPADLRMGVVWAVLGPGISNGSAVLIPRYDPDAGTLMWFVPSTGAQVANGVDLSTYNGRLEFVGR